MSVDREVAIIRSAAGLSRLDHVRVIRVAGPGALDVLSRASLRPLSVRDAEVAHTLFLRADGKPVFEVYIGRVEHGGYYLLADGPGNIVEHLATIQDGSRVHVDDVSSEFVLWGIDGPRAPDVAAALVGPAVHAMLHHTITPLAGGSCFRFGRTGEHGYTLLMERADAYSFASKLEKRGGPLGLAPVTLAALDRGALETWTFSIRLVPEVPLVTPLELPFPWDVSDEHEHVASEALRRRRAQGITQRLTCVTAERKIRPGARVYCGGREVGQLLAASWSPTCKQWIGMALLPTAIPRHDPLMAERTPIVVRMRNTSTFANPDRRRSVMAPDPAMHVACG